MAVMTGLLRDAMHVAHYAVTQEAVSVVVAAVVAQQHPIALDPGFVAERANDDRGECLLQQQNLARADRRG